MASNENLPQRAKTISKIVITRINNKEVNPIFINESRITEPFKRKIRSSGRAIRTSKKYLNVKN